MTHEIRNLEISQNINLTLFRKKLKIEELQVFMKYILYYKNQGNVILLLLRTAEWMKGCMRKSRPRNH